MKQFNLGDLAVYPNHGVGKVVSIEEMNLGSTTVSCYVITTLSSDSKLFVPINNANKMGLRRITPQTETTDIYRCFETKNPDLLRMNWNKRYRFLQDKMKVGTAYDVAMVISDLLYLKKLKGLSYGEEKLLTDAEDILTTELSIAEKIPKSDVKEKIYNIIA